MITDSLNLKLEYEYTRLRRYAHVTKRVFYAYEELTAAYEAWANHPYGREYQWDTYCDIRDNVPHGTNARIRTKRGESRFN